MVDPAPGARPEGAARCYRHPDREAYISCQRCERPICPDDMRDASVGFQCPECVQRGAKAVRTPRTVAGGALQSREGIVSMVLIGVNVAVYALQLATGDLRSPLYRDGTLWPYGVAQGEYWRLLTSAFLHLSVLHIAFNMYALFLFGPFVERALGTARFIAAYVTTAVVSGVFVLWLSDPLGGTAGASGAVFGLFGMALVLLLKARQDVRGLLVLLAINGAISFTGNISWQGHLGGFVAGLLLGFVFAYAPRERRTLVQVVSFAGLWAAVVVAVLVRTAQLGA
jgi:membrane associated rhomboid family serine protease